MKTYLVTGASGFIGSRLIRELTKSGAKVIAFTRKDIDNPDIEQIFGDFANLDDLEQLKGRNIDVVIHLAGVTGDANEEDAIVVNVAGIEGALSANTYLFPDETLAGANVE